MNSFIDQVIVDLIVVKLVDSCGNLMHRLASSCGEIGLNIRLTKTKISRAGNTPHNIGRQVREE